MEAQNIIGVLIGIGTIMLTVIGYFLKSLVTDIKAMAARQIEGEKVQIVTTQQIAAIVDKLAVITERLDRQTEIPERVKVLEAKIIDILAKLKTHEDEIEFLRVRDHELGNGVSQLVGLARLNKLQYVEELDFKLPRWKFGE